MFLGTSWHEPESSTPGLFQWAPSGPVFPSHVQALLSIAARETWSNVTPCVNSLLITSPHFPFCWEGSWSPGSSPLFLPFVAYPSSSPPVLSSFLSKLDSRQPWMRLGQDEQALSGGPLCRVLPALLWVCSLDESPSSLCPPLLFFKTLISGRIRQDLATKQQQHTLCSIYLFCFCFCCWFLHVDSKP